MSSQRNNSSKKKSRTYARNRTNLSRRGYEKNPESDGIFLLKLIICVVAGSLWLKFLAPLNILGLYLAGFPVGAIIGALIIFNFEKRQINRKILLAVLVLTTVISYFVPAGIVI